MVDFEEDIEVDWVLVCVLVGDVTSQEKVPLITLLMTSLRSPNPFSHTFEASSGSRRYMNELGPLLWHEKS